MGGRVIRVDASQLRAGISGLFAASGMDADKAAVVAEMLVEADLIGHSTHGSALAGSYLGALAAGELNGSGVPDVVADRGSCVTWRGNRLPGAWLIRQALDLACERAPQYGVVTVAIGGSHRTGALAAYLRQVTERGLVGEICCSTTSAARMAPFGGTRPVLTPNPLAIGFPTDGDPILIDLSASITTTTMTRSLAAKGERYPEQWALTATGEPTDDPCEVTVGGGTLMPLGGAHKGYKGFGLALMVDVLSQGLADSRARTRRGRCRSPSSCRSLTPKPSADAPPSRAMPVSPRRLPRRPARPGRHQCPCPRRRSRQLTTRRAQRGCASRSVGRGGSRCQRGQARPHTRRRFH